MSDSKATLPDFHDNLPLDSRAIIIAAILYRFLRKKISNAAENTAKEIFYQQKPFIFQLEDPEGGGDSGRGAMVLFCPLLVPYGSL